MAVRSSALLASGYHQGPFALLHDELKEEIRIGLTQEPFDVSGDHLKAALPIGVLTPPHKAWPIFKNLLTHLEKKLAEIANARSIVFWLHLYRRLKPVLSPLHISQTDARTAALVRQITELAMFKFGQAGEANELELSSRIHPKMILGGEFIRALKHVQPRGFSSELRVCHKHLHAYPQFVVTEFERADFINLYRIEGYAYEYWRATAAMRAIGKGFGIILQQNGNWEYSSSDKLRDLVASIDRRTLALPFEGSLVGTWFANEDSPHDSMDDLIVAMHYNTDCEDVAPLLAAFGLELSNRYESNFVPAAINAREFLASHDYLSAAFMEKWGTSLAAVMGVLWALSLLVFMPKNNSLEKKDFAQPLMTMLTRGYKHLAWAEVGPDVLGPYVRKLLNRDDISNQEVGSAIELIALKKEKQEKIGLWSGGPRPILIPHADIVIADCNGIGDLLFRLFVGLRHDGNQRGDLFEEEFREALKSRGFAPISGELKNLADEKRELDAGVFVGVDLFIFECVSIERPLDYELSNPATMAGRRERLQAKLTQVLGLRDFLAKDRKGKNYNFSKAERIVPVVVSAFVEWAWDSSDDLWINKTTPRIMSAREALDFLETRKSQS